MKALLRAIVVCAVVGQGGMALAAVITVAGDPIGGGQLVGSTFTIATAGTADGVNNFPGGEPPQASIDGNTGSKYLNFAELNTGYIVTPASGSSIVTGINFTTAGDAPERDPSSYSLYGSNSVVASTTPGATFDLSNFTLINNSVLALLDGRGDSSVNAAFANANPYTT